MTTNLATKQPIDNGSILEKVMLGTDLSSLSPVEKVQHIRNMCDSLGLNPVTTPIKLMKFQGKEIPYFAKEATEQLRVLRKVSIKIVESKIIDDLFMVIAEASTPDGRIDSSTGAISIQGLKGEAKANAIMKAETKAKRRVTLSICGLGYCDESEMDFAIKEKHNNVIVKQIKQPALEQLENDNDDHMDLAMDIKMIESAISLEDLQVKFTSAYKFWKGKNNQPAIDAVIKAKDHRKGELDVAGFNEEIDANTGEVKS